MSKLGSIQSDIRRLQNLIDESNEALHLPVSHYRQNVQKTISKHRDYFAVQFQQMIRSGQPQKIIVGGAILGGAWLLAAGVDELRNSSAQRKTKAALSAYYQELAAKNHLLIQEQQRLIRQLTEQKEELQEDRQALENRLNHITQIISKIAEEQKQQKQ